MASSRDQSNEIPCWNKECPFFERHKTVLNCTNDGFKICKQYVPRKTTREVQLEAKLKHAIDVLTN